MSATAWIWPAVTSPGPCARSDRRLGPSACMRSAICFTLSTMSVTSSRTPAIEENSCSTPSIWIEVTAAPCSDDSSTRRSALPSVRPKPRSSGSAVMVAERPASCPASTLELLRLDQFLPVLLKHFVLIVSRTCRTTPITFDGLVLRPKILLHAAALRRPAAIVRDRRHVADRGDDKPTACSARSADSRPEPGPLTSTSSVRMPCSIAFLPASSAATCAA